MGWQALARYQPRGEDPDVSCRDLEESGRNGVDVSIQFIHACRYHGADGRPDELAVELRFRGCAEQVSGLEVLEQVAGLQGSGFGDPAGEEIDDDGVGAVGGSNEGEDELG